MPSPRASMQQGLAQPPLGANAEAISATYFAPSVKTTLRLMPWRYQCSLPVNCLKSALLKVFASSSPFSVGFGLHLLMQPWRRRDPRRQGAGVRMLLATFLGGTRSCGGSQNRLRPGPYAAPGAAPLSKSNGDSRETGNRRQAEIVRERALPAWAETPSAPCFWGVARGPKGHGRQVLIGGNTGGGRGKGRGSTPLNWGNVCVTLWGA
jgi:hypothetical protein